MTSALKVQSAPEHKVIAPPQGKQKLSRDLVLSALKGMRLGRMEIECADGMQVVIGQENARVSAKIFVHRHEFFEKCLLYSHIGFAEAYMDGDWDTPDIKSVISWFVLNLEDSTVFEGSSGKKMFMNSLGWLNRASHLLRSNSISGSKKNISEHYDLSNELFALFLDPTMTYSSAKFTRPDMSLEEAQMEKVDSICRKLMLSASDHLLEIGSGWGTLAIHAAKKYGCRVTTVTISEQQFAYAKKRIEEAGLSSQIEIRMCDYRYLEGIYDKIVSVEMIEAVGDKFMETYFASINRLLKPHGLVGLQMITCPDSRYKILRDNVDFIQKYIFPGSLLPSVGRVTEALNRTGSLNLFEMEDIGLSYAKTLDMWHENFNNRLDEVRALGFDERFIRKWNYYFKYCSAAFAMRNISAVQAIYTRPNNLTIAE
ncbi:MAG: cyclopropane-fatty-acyl-phospholipid synthase family protein [Candidatus Obscuribacterales bacterium]|nr:cyclopropane-fatty-acyl-phospholipid synthase family protein [Candidatus Obscuribacterales bacterium]